MLIKFGKALLPSSCPCMSRGSPCWNRGLLHGRFCTPSTLLMQQGQPMMMLYWYLRTHVSCFQLQLQGSASPANHPQPERDGLPLFWNPKGRQSKEHDNEKARTHKLMREEWEGNRLKFGRIRTGGRTPGRRRTHELRVKRS